MLAHLNNFNVYAFWGPREETAESCAERLQQFLRSLQEVGELFAGWRIISSKSPAVDPEDFPGLVNLMLKTRYKNDDTPRGYIPQLGFNPDLVNDPLEKGQVVLRICCGVYSQYNKNKVSLRFEPQLGDLKELHRMLKLVTATVKCWQPENIEIYSHRSRDVRDMGQRREASCPFLDWMLYLSQEKYARPILEPPAKLYEVAEHGWIVVTNDEIPDPDDPEQRANIRRVEKALGMPEFNDYE